MTKFVLKWENITVTITQKEQNIFGKAKQTTKIILDDVSGEAESKTLVAIMGSSGSGKTTLLGAISGQLAQKSGKLFINDNWSNDTIIKSISGYVYQNDIFTESLTVFEELLFKISLQAPDKSIEDRKSTIQHLLIDLGLDRVRDVRIKNLSGGERRRLSLADELLNDPLILFCDEPTTGLDSYNAIAVVQKLQKIAASGKIVITTIHQPSSQLFECFDNLMLLAQGKLVFQGSKQAAKNYFESMDLFCPDSYNPADFYIKNLSTGDIETMCEIYKLRSRIMRDKIVNREIISSVKKQNSLIFELKWLLWRNFIDETRDMSKHVVRYLIFMLSGLFIAIAYSYTTLSDTNSVQNVQGLLFTIICELIFTHMYAVIYVFPEEMSIFLREKSLYRPLPYFLSKLLSLVPLCLFSAATYSALFFTIVNIFKGFDLWLEITYILFILTLVSCSAGLAFSATFSRVEHIDLLMGPIELILMIISGFYLTLNSRSVYINWLRYLSPFYYGFTSISILFWKDISYIDNCAGNSTAPCFSSGTDVLAQYGILQASGSIAMNILSIHVLTAILCVAGYAGILRRRCINSVY